MAGSILLTMKTLLHKRSVFLLFMHLTMLLNMKVHEMWISEFCSYGLIFSYRSLSTRILQEGFISDVQVLAKKYASPWASSLSLHWLDAFVEAFIFWFFSGLLRVWWCARVHSHLWRLVPRPQHSYQRDCMWFESYVWCKECSWNRCEYTSIV